MRDIVRHNRVPGIATTAIAVTAVSAAVVAGPQLAERAESAAKPKTATQGSVDAAGAARPPAAQSTIKPPRKDLPAPKDAEINGNDSVKLTQSTLHQIAAE